LSKEFIISDLNGISTTNLLLYFISISTDFSRFLKFTKHLRNHNYLV